LRAFLSNCDLLRSGIRLLDAGCGTGNVTLALLEAFKLRACHCHSIDGFDLTPAMLERFQKKLTRMRVPNVQLCQADVMRLESLPPVWQDYDMVVSASMLEYLPPESLAGALAALRARLGPQGALLLFITKRNWLMKLLIERLWVSNRYSRQQLITAFSQAGFHEIMFRKFPLNYFWLNQWGFIIEAKK
jgi:cyclopropane fatty-acyl-phospholipid synthase-like methyltransferase